mgnify:CR=1 FL=1
MQGARLQLHSPATARCARGSGCPHSLPATSAGTRAKKRSAERPALRTAGIKQRSLVSFKVKRVLRQAVCATKHCPTLPARAALVVTPAHRKGAATRAPTCLTLHLSEAHAVLVQANAVEIIIICRHSCASRDRSARVCGCKSARRVSHDRRSTTPAASMGCPRWALPPLACGAGQ